MGSSVNDLLTAIRNWRRWAARSCELHLTIPDLILMQVLGQAVDSLARHGRTQVSYRLSSLRQELQLDHRPCLGSALEYAEICRVYPSGMRRAGAFSGEFDYEIFTNPQPSANQPPSGGAPPALKAVALGGQGDGQKGSTSSGKASQPCKYWGSQGGCRRGEACGYLHSWENLEKDRCFICSGKKSFFPGMSNQGWEGKGEGKRRSNQQGKNPRLQRILRGMRRRHQEDRCR